MWLRQLLFKEFGRFGNYLKPFIISSPRKSKFYSTTSWKLEQNPSNPSYIQNWKAMRKLTTCELNLTTKLEFISQIVKGRKIRLTFLPRPVRSCGPHLPVEISHIQDPVLKKSFGDNLDVKQFILILLRVLTLWTFEMWFKRLSHSLTVCLCCLCQRSFQHLRIQLEQHQFLFC